MSSSGVPLVDSIPLVLYIFPLVIILFSILHGYYSTHIGLGAIIILFVTGLVFGILALLVRGFAVLAILNISAAILIPLTGPVRSKVSWRDAGRKGIAWLIILNILGAGFPIAVYVMGKTPIAYVDAAAPENIEVDIPLLSLNGPTNKSIQLMETSGVNANLRLFDYLPESWESLFYYLSNLTGHTIDVTITITPNRNAFAQPTLLGSDTMFNALYSNFSTDLQRINNLIQNTGFSPSDITIMLDLRLSMSEWNTLMTITKNLNFMAFASLIRATVDNTNREVIQQAIRPIFTYAEEKGMKIGGLVDSLVLDDYLDGDGTIMLACGLLPDLISKMSLIEIDISRTKFSNSMLGDVGSYLAFSYAKTIGSFMNNKWSLRLGEVNASDNGTAYTTVEKVSNDLAIVGGCGVEKVTLESLQGILALGDDALSKISGLADVPESLPINYTFRIYAFRSVTMAIDIFNPIMF